MEQGWRKEACGSGVGQGGGEERGERGVKSVGGEESIFGRGGFYTSYTAGDLRNYLRLFWFSPYFCAFFFLFLYIFFNCSSEIT